MWQFPLHSFKIFWKEKIDPLFYFLNILKKIIWNHIFCTTTEVEDQYLKNILWRLKSKTVLQREFQHASMHTFSSSTKKKSQMNYVRQILLFKVLFINPNLQINIQGGWDLETSLKITFESHFPLLRCLHMLERAFHSVPKQTPFLRINFSST